MKRKFLIILLTTMMITETIILYKQNINVREKSSKLLKELTENNLVINDEVNLEEVKSERENLKEETQLVFKDNDAKSAFEELKEKEETLTSEISTLENDIIGLESSLGSLQQEYNKLYKAYQAKNTFYITGVPIINQYPKHFPKQY